MAPSRHDFVDWDVKPQHKQIKDALYFIVICVVVLEIIGKMACFKDSK